jgi:NADH dehydrogenase
MSDIIIVLIYSGITALAIGLGVIPLTYESNMEGLPADCFTHVNQIKINRINKVLGSENIFAIGDIAFMETPKYVKGHPQVANVAINQGKYLAKNFKRIIQWKVPLDYEYRDLGSRASRAFFR